MIFNVIDINLMGEIVRRNALSHVTALQIKKVNQN